MTNPTQSSESREDRLHKLIAEYLRRVEQGDKVDAEQFIAPYPELAERFRQCLKDAAFLDALKASRRTGGDAPTERGTAGSVAADETIPPSYAAGGHDEAAQPRQFGRYRLVKLLGEGAMGAVYLAEDPELQRQVALKIPKFLKGEDAASLERFYREARAAATLNHPNVCQVHDIGEQDGTPFITMAYVQGKPLSSLVKTKRQWPERDVAKFARKIALALTEAHAKGVVHRDLKPGNIMLDQRHEPIVMDFGLAGRANRPGEEKLTQTGVLLGTPAYMAPEQAKADFEQVGPRSDIYSLGVICYELLTGRPPFEGSLAAVIAQIVCEEPQRPSKLRASLDGRLEAICLKMMAKLPQDRFATATEVADALRKYLEETAAPGGPSSQQSTADAIRVLEARKGEIVGLLRAGQFRPAIEALQELGRADGPGAGPYAAWAQGELARVRALPRDLLDKGPAIVGTAIELVASQQYAEAARLLESVPADYRSAEAAKILEKAARLEQEAARLNARMQEAMRTRQYEGLQAELSRFLELQPGNLTARDLYDKLSTYAPGQPYRFDKDGGLLSARRTPLRVLLGNALRRTLRGYAERRQYTRGPGGRRVRMSPEGASAGSGFPIVPVAVAAAVLGLIFLGIVVVLQDGRQTVRVEIDDKLLADKSVTLKIDGQTMAIAGLGETIRLAPGPHGYEIRRGDEIIAAREFTVLRGDNRAVRISVEDKPVVAARTERASPAPAEPASPTERKDATIRHFGYVVWDGPPSVVSEIAPYTNVVVDTSWLRLGHGILEAARKARVPAVLVIFARERDGIENRLFATMEEYRGTIQGIYWAAGLTSGYSPAQVTEFAKAVKSRFPKAEIWVSAEEREFGAMPSPIPSEVDAIVVNDRNDCTPEAVRAKTDEILPKWLEKVGNREIILNWQSGATPSVKDGLVPKCQAGTCRECVKAAKKHRLAGVLFTFYDGSKERDMVGIRTRPELVEEVKQCAQDLGIAGRAPVVIGAPGRQADETRPPQWFGYDLGADPLKFMAEVSTYTNIVLDDTWQNQGDACISAARKHGLPVVMLLNGRKDIERFKTEGIAILRRNRDIIPAVMLKFITYFGLSPEEIAEFARGVKRDAPGVQCWAAMVDKAHDTLTYPVPSEVDVLVAECFDCFSPGEVRKRSRDLFPKWIAKAKPGALILCWNCSRADGVTLCEPGTFRAMGDVAKELKVSGLLFRIYGPATYPKSGTCLGIESRPELVREIRQVAEEWGVVQQRASSGPPGSTLLPQPAEEGFVSLFDGATLNGWRGDPRLWRVVDGTIVGSTKGVDFDVLSYLCTTKRYRDFILKVKFKLREGNSGIQFRSEQGADYKVAGCQAEIGWPPDQNRPNQAIGLYFQGQQRESKWIVRDNLLKQINEQDWNEYVITCQGPHITLQLNGYITVDYIEDQPATEEGIIGFQIMRLPNRGFPETQVEFKDIRIKELTSAGGPRSQAELGNQDKPSDWRVFVGQWICPNSRGGTFLITLYEDFTATHTLDPKATGKWEYVRGEVHIVWNNGTRHILRKKGEGYQKLHFPRGLSLDSPPAQIDWIRKGPELAPARKSVLLITGPEVGAKWHDWRATTPVVVETLQKDPRLRVRVVESPAFIADPSISQYDAIVLHVVYYTTSQVPSMGPQGRDNFRNYVRNGGGVFLIHSACLARPDWPEFRHIVGRVWDPKLSAHDPRGPFRVQFTGLKHPISEGLQPFDTDDELYIRLLGERPIEILATARSKADGKDYPIAFVCHQGKGRVFQCLLGHDAKAMQVPQVGELYRRGCAWVAGLPVLPRAE